MSSLAAANKNDAKNKEEKKIIKQVKKKICLNAFRIRFII